VERAANAPDTCTDITGARSEESLRVWQLKRVPAEILRFGRGQAIGIPHVAIARPRSE